MKNMTKQRVWNKKGIRAFPLRLTELFFTYRMNGLERLALILSYAAEKSPVFACHIAKLKANGQPSALVRLCGKEGSGRRFFLRHLVSERGCAILSLPLSELCEMQETYRREVLNGLSMITRLSGLVLAFEGAVPKGKERIAAYIVERLLSVSKVLFWVCESEEKLEVPETAEALSLNFALPTPPERLLLWEKFSCDCKLSPEVQLSFFANTYKLSPEEIGSVLKQAKAETDFESLSPPFGKKPKRIEKSRLVAISSGRGTEKLSGLADRISPAFG
ncbi:MAG: hypothetical protein GX025_02075 [Clostridiales bacterium]|nr:hypothetical protein [Clostridiales bacterium]